MKLPYQFKEAVRNTVMAVLDATEKVTGRREPMTPPRRLNNVGSASRFRSDFNAIGKELLGYLINDGGLKPDDRVLDVGCGVGRMAIAMNSYLTAGTYDGFDIVKQSIDYCQKAITPVRPSFRFKHADIYSSEYNAQGTIRPADFRFPYRDGAFTFVFLTSVFTHMQRPELETYLAEISRVLAPGGRVFATYFLLNPVSLAAIAADRNNEKFPFLTDKGRVQHQFNVDAAVAFEEDYIADLYPTRGMRVTQIKYGSWTGEKTNAGYQDALVAVKD